MGIRAVLCPVCRQAVADKDYYAHAKAHQAKMQQAKLGNEPEPDERKRG